MTQPQKTEIIPHEPISHFEKTWASYNPQYRKFRDFMDYWSCRAHEIGREAAQKELDECTHRFAKSFALTVRTRGNL